MQPNMLEVLHTEDFRKDNIISTVKVVSSQAPYQHSGLERLLGALHP